MADMEKIISDAADSPKDYELDGEKTSAHPLPDLIDADEHLQRRKAAKNPLATMRIFKISRPGAL